MTRPPYLRIHLKEILFLILLCLVFGCKESHKATQKRIVTKDIVKDTIKIDTVETDTIVRISGAEAKDVISSYIQGFPKINDSVKLVAALYKSFNLSFYPEFNKGLAIKYSGKIKLHGSEKSYFFIEYKYDGSAGSDYPWKHQFLLTEGGEPLEYFFAERYEFVSVFKNKNPYLLIVELTIKGNGGHALYSIENDKLVNVYDGFSDYFPRTYDAHEDNNINEPFELNLKIKDRNNDGFNDISFSGYIVHGTKKIPVEYIFLYDKKSGHFKEKEDYSKKYMYLEYE